MEERKKKEVSQKSILEIQIFNNLVWLLRIKSKYSLEC